MDIASVRTSLGLTQAEFAERVGTTTAYVGHLETGRRKPSLELCARIERQFGVYGLVAARVAEKTGQAA
jgi:transcriptional regulator with XRE-family HTH domain